MFGTDGEKAFSHKFLFALCFNHVQRKIKNEPSKLELPKDICMEILEDIFGKKVEATMYKGLVNCKDVSMFDEKFERKQHSTHHDKIEEFCLWLSRNKAETIRSSMLRAVREDAGLGSPPQAFYTNASESVNNVVKCKIDFIRNDLPRNWLWNKIGKWRGQIIGRGKYYTCKLTSPKGVLKLVEGKTHQEDHVYACYRSTCYCCIPFNSQPQSCEFLSAELHCLSENASPCL